MIKKPTEKESKTIIAQVFIQVRLLVAIISGR